MSSFSILDEKTAATMAKAMTEIQSNKQVHINVEDWKATDKKPEIVNLWCMFEKNGRSGNNRSTPKFNFTETAKHGLTFYGWGLLEAGAIIAIKTALDELGVKYHADGE